MKQLLDVSTIRDASTLDKENPFQSITQIEDTEDSIDLALEIQNKIEKLKEFS